MIVRVSWLPSVQYNPITDNRYAWKSFISTGLLMMSFKMCTHPNVNSLMQGNYDNSLCV